MRILSALGALLLLLPICLFASGRGEVPSNHSDVIVTIKHCNTWAYKSKAASLAEKIEKELQLIVKHEKGAFQSFDVFVGDTLIFSKQQEGRLPEEAEILAAIRKYLSTESNSQ